MSREPFKRATKATLSIQKSDLGAVLRALLTKRIEPQVKYLVAELAELAEHAARRFEEELERMCEGLQVAVSAFVSEVANDSKPAKAVLLSQARPDLATYKLGPLGPEPDNDVRGGGNPSPGCAVPEPAVAAEQGSTSSPKRCKPGQHSFTVNGASHGVTFCEHCGEGRIDADEELDAARAAGTARSLSDVQRDTKPSNGRKCSKCGLPGGRADHCGTDHQPLKPQGFGDQVTKAIEDIAEKFETPFPPRRMKSVADLPKKATVGPQMIDVQATRVPSAYETAKAKVDRLAALKTRNAHRPVAHRDDEPGDDNPNADERWSQSDIDRDKREHESNKLSGELPDPISSWSF